MSGRRVFFFQVFRVEKRKGSQMSTTVYCSITTADSVTGHTRPFFDVCKKFTPFSFRQIGYRSTKNRLYSKESLSGIPDIENSQIFEPTVVIIQHIGLIYS
jgi:hypothetical protein